MIYENMFATTKVKITKPINHYAKYAAQLWFKNINVVLLASYLVSQFPIPLSTGSQIQIHMVYWYNHLRHRFNIHTYIIDISNAVDLIKIYLALQSNPEWIARNYLILSIDLSFLIKIADSGYPNSLGSVRNPWLHSSEETGISL